MRRRICPSEQRESARGEYKNISVFLGVKNGEKKETTKTLTPVDLRQRGDQMKTSSIFVDDHIDTQSLSALVVTILLY